MNWFKRLAADYGYVTDSSGRVFWGKQGSGCVFVRNHPKQGRQILLVLRSPDVEQPNTWGTTGGALPVGETDLFLSAIRETIEEIGLIPPFKKIGEYKWKAPNGTFTYTTFILEIDDMNWTPMDFNWEVSDAVWVNAQELPEFDLHFGMESILQKSPIFKQEMPDETQTIGREQTSEDDEERKI